MSSDYQRGVPSNELQIYTWMDATLKELTRLITEVYPNTKIKGTTFNFNVVWPGPRESRFFMKDIGQTTIGSKGPDDNATLQARKFVIGDYLDVAVSTPRADRERDRPSERDRVASSRDNRGRGGRYGDYR
jgi:histone deacetylase complex subunit SAP18